MTNSEKFIEKSKTVHNNYYDYSKVNYVNTHTKVEIVCPEHGSFYQDPANHQKGSGCKLCANKNRAKNKTKSFDSFLKDANLVHNNFYIYEKTKFTKRTEKAIITCPIHGDFEQLINNHLKGEGCPICGKLKTSEKRTKTQDEFIRECKNIHGDNYDYSNSIYLGYHEKFCIICPIHGEFWQTPANHLNGKGCNKCASDKMSIEKRDSFEDFVNKANLIHNNLYTYENNYINQLTKITILCNKHGKFDQTPNAHLRGQGCPKCNNSKGELMIQQWLKNNYPNLNFIEQYRAEWINGLIYDFYIPELNLAIEYNGIQHYEPIDFFGGEDYFNYCVNNDNLKKEYSNNNETKLILIKYNNEKEDMNILKNIIDVCYQNVMI